MKSQALASGWGRYLGRQWGLCALRITLDRAIYLALSEAGFVTEDSIQEYFWRSDFGAQFASRKWTY